jgi:hypothetical protein
MLASAINLLNGVLGNGASVPTAFPPPNFDQKRDEAQRATLGLGPQPTTGTADAVRTAAANAGATATTPGPDQPTIQPTSEQALADAQVSRRAATIALAYRTHGEADAAREMRAQTRNLPPSAAAEVVIASRATLESIVTSTFGLERRNGSDSIVTELARIIDYVGRDHRGDALAGNTAALILDALGRGADEYRLSTLALGIPFGTGLTLPLALAEELERRRDRRRRQLLLRAMEQGLQRLRQRIAATVGALIDLTRPLPGLLAGESEAGAREQGRVRQFLQDHAARDATLLGEFGHALRRVDTVGHDAFLALDAMARRGAPLELHGVRAELLGSQATAFAIAQSPSAQDTALRDTNIDAHGEGPTQTTTMTPASAARVYQALGFTKSRSTLLAHAAATWRSQALLDARWTVFDWSGDLDRQGRIFEALVHFIGATPTQRHIQAIDLSTIDDDPVQPVWGLPLFRSLGAAA